MGCCGTLTENTIRLQFFFERSSKRFRAKKYSIAFAFFEIEQKIAFEQTLSLFELAFEQQLKKCSIAFEQSRSSKKSLSSKRFRLSSNRDLAFEQTLSNRDRAKIRFRAAIELSLFEQSRSSFRAINHPYNSNCCPW